MTTKATPLQASPSSPDQSHVRATTHRVGDISGKLSRASRQQKHTLAVVIGRFQPVHRGHEHLIEQAAAIADNVLVLIGSAHEPRSPKNPWTYVERRDMIASTDIAKQLESNLYFSPLVDAPYSDTQWATQVQRIIDLVLEELESDDVVLVGHKKDDSTYYLDMFPQLRYVDISPVSVFNSNCLDATRVRELLFQNHLEFIRGVLSPAVFDVVIQLRSTTEFQDLLEDYNHIRQYKDQWAASPYPPIFVTTDAVVVQSGHVLLIKRGHSPGKGQYALPGGFVQSTERLFDGCVRELYEETTLKVQEKIVRRCYVGTKVFDAPGRSLRGRTITHAFLFHLNDFEGLPKVKAADDAALAWWVPLSEIPDLRPQMFEDHATIIDEMIKLI